MFKQLRNRLARWFVLLAALSAIPALSQDATPQARVSKPLMWKASSPSATVYLLGSIHVGDSSMYPLPAAVESAFASSKVLAVEINVKALDQSKAIKLVQEYGIYSGDDVLSNHIPKETVAALNDFLDKAGLPKESFEKVKPWVAAVTVVAIALKQAGEDSALGVDMHFLNQVKEPQRIDELESAEFQMSLFAAASEQEQQEFLASALRQTAKTKEMIRKMQDAYISGDGDTLLALLNEQDQMPKTLIKKLLEDRNVTMAERIETYLKGKEPCFVVVGAAHILGEKGIATLLQAKGYRVELVPMAAQ